jgi:hypothetical protein|tara:strand:- start:2731 stop:3783 length:1053 start_codon:yes stop_codon:yes gene_type:complete
MKPSIARAIALKTLEGGITPFLLGGTGVGKSAVVLDIANELAGNRKLSVDNLAPNSKEFGFIDFRLSLLESVDLGGLPYLDKDNNQKRAFLGNLPTKGEGLLFLDEFAQAHPSVQTLAGQLIKEKRLGEYVLPEGWKVVCAGNRSSDRASSNKIPSHVVGRVSLIEFEHDFNDWSKWATSHGVDSRVMGYLNYQPQALNDFDSKELGSQPSPRTWTNLSDVLKTNPDESIIQELVKSFVGEVQAIEFKNFLLLMNDIPNLTEIVEGRCKQTIEDVGLCFATATALIDVVTNANDKKVFTYFENALDFFKECYPTPEFSIFFVRQCTEKRSELIDTDSYSAFKLANRDLEY